MSPRTNHAPAWGDEVLRIDPTARQRPAHPIDRPTPPPECAEDEPETFVPAPAFADWIRDTFISATGPLANEDHEHLLEAHLGVLWTNAINVSKQRTVMGTAEIPNAMAGGWKRARFEFQLRQWFGAVPHFVLTFSAPLCEELSDRAFCALVEHELYHCAQAIDSYGSPRFDRLGAPIYAVKGHDLEQFIGVTNRYGATSEAEREFAAAVARVPMIDDEPIEIACGTCMPRAA